MFYSFKWPLPFWFPSQRLFATAFLWDSPPSQNLEHSWNKIRALAIIADFTWQEHLTVTVPLCFTELLWINIYTGYYIRIDIAHDPEHILNICEWMLWLMGSEIHEL